MSVIYGAIMADQDLQEEIERELAAMGEVTL
jgi:hypothetical protein